MSHDDVPAAEFARLHVHLRELTSGWIERAIEAGEVRPDVDAKRS